jgi:hypothetical protein
MPSGVLKAEPPWLGQSSSSDWLRDWARFAAPFFLAERDHALLRRAHNSHAYAFRYVSGSALGDASWKRTAASRLHPARSGCGVDEGCGRPPAPQGGPDPGGHCASCDAERSLGFRVFLTMQSRAKEFRINAAVCTMHAAAVPDPMKPFYQALELQWECLARLAEREALNSNGVDATKAAA